MLWAIAGGVLALVFLGVYLLVRRGSKQATKLGGSKAREKAYKESAELSRRAAKVRARPRRTPQQLLDRLRRRTGSRRPSDASVSKP